MPTLEVSFQQVSEEVRSKVLQAERKVGKKRILVASFVSCNLILDIVNGRIYSMYFRRKIQNANIVYCTSFGRKLVSWESFAVSFFLYAMVTLDARFQKRERLLWLYKATDMYWNYKAKKTEDDPSTPCSNLESKRLWERAFFKWKDAMRACMSE